MLDTHSHTTIPSSQKDRNRKIMLTTLSSFRHAVQEAERSERRAKPGRGEEKTGEERGGWVGKRQQSVKSEIENKMVRNGDGACVREGETGRKRREEVLVKGKCLLLCIQKDRFSESNSRLCTKSNCCAIQWNLIDTKTST